MLLNLYGIPSTSCLVTAMILSTFVFSEIKEKVSQLKVKLEHLKHKLSLAVAGQGGGAFEWIDSLLVRSLREGHWLLIDNVNFCR
jgi:midasin (ATPase involved in ribosome maturation)